MVEVDAEVCTGSGDSAGAGTRGIVFVGGGVEVVVAVVGVVEISDVVEGVVPVGCAPVGCSFVIFVILRMLFCGEFARFGVEVLLYICGMMCDVGGLDDVTTAGGQVRGNHSVG